ncbi:TorF family putative porin [Ideonella sp. DXS22W]|uniref:TorF family putative porin n=1 Tax=Pseudaquabacterium inlustre TaxID=2984192 RepID=A0ABU9CN15_9BURK
MKKTSIILSAALAAAAAAAVPSLAFADDGLAYNIGAVSDYRYRGISQTRLKPALQGGVDYTKGAFYLGAWASTIKWIKDASGDAGLEVDLYGGYKGEISKDFTYDVGVLNYWYPSAVTPAWSAAYRNPNTTELYGALTYGPVTAKYSHGFTNLFGNVDSKNSYYLDLSATFEVAGLSVVPHVGYQKVKNTANASYTDYSITVSKDFGGIVPSVALVGTDADKGFYVPGAAANSSKFLGKAALVVGVKYNF